MKIIAHFAASIVFMAVLWVSYAYVLSGGKLGAEAWTIGLLYLMFVGPVGYAVVAAISFFGFGKKRGWAAVVYLLALLLVIGIVSVLLVIRPRNLASWTMWPGVLGPILLGAAVRDLVLLAFDRLSPDQSTA